MTEPLIVLDAGVVAAVTANRSLRAEVEQLARAGWTPVIPTVVLAEATTGRPSDAPVNQAVRRIGTTTTDEATARLAGALRFRAASAGGRRAPSAIDAIVAAHAARAETGVVYTTDPADLRRLLADYPRIGVQKPQS